MFLKKFIQKKIAKHNKREFINISYSQYGEDLILSGIFSSKKNGFYVDVGAHHPKRFSNTCKFYNMGWRGINIDPLPGTKNIFDKERPNDINIEIGVNSAAGNLDYFIFNEPALNSFDPETLTKFKDHPVYKVVKKIEIPVKRLDEILNQYKPAEVEIDFLNIDAEGLDLEILKSNDWNKYRPKIVVCEILNFDNPISEISKTNLAIFMEKVGYKPIIKGFNNVFFLRS